MSRTRRRDGYDNFSVPKQLVHDSREDEDTDPRTYNVIQHNRQKWDARRLEKAFSDRSESMGLHVWDE